MIRRCCLAFLFLLGLSHAAPGLAQRPPPFGVVETPLQPHERETAQAGGQGFGSYSYVGVLRCGTDQALVGVALLGQSPAQGLRLRCAPVRCDSGGCTLGAGADGPASPGAAGQGLVRACTAGQVVAGYSATVARDSVADLQLTCGAPVGQRSAGTTRLLVVAQAPTPAPFPESPRPTGMRLPTGVDPGQAVADTRGNAAQRYGDILTRSAYYGAMDGVLRGHPPTADMRFFAAAQAVTDVFHVGGVATLPGAMIHSPGAITVLERVNAALFAANMGVLRRVLLAGGPVDPLARTDPPPPRGTATQQGGVRGDCGSMAATAVSLAIARPGVLRAVSLYCGRPDAARPACPRTPGFGFDLRMVEMEQGTVETLLRTDPAIRAAMADPSTIDDINRSMNLRGDALRSLRGQLPPERVNDLPANWAREALRRPYLDFRVKIERIAIGTAFVFLLHGCAQADHARYLQAEMARLVR